MPVRLMATGVEVGKVAANQKFADVAFWDGWSGWRGSPDVTFVDPRQFKLNLIELQTMSHVRQCSDENQFCQSLL